MSNQYKAITDKYGFIYYIIQTTSSPESIKTKSWNISESRKYWKIAEPDSILLLFDAGNIISATQFAALTYAKVSLDPESGSGTPEIVELEPGILAVRKIFVEEFRPFHTFPGFLEAAFCRYAYIKNNVFVHLFRCPESALFIFLKVRNPGDILFLPQTPDNSAWKIQILRENPTFIRNIEFPQDLAVHNLILSDFPEFLEEIRNPARGTVREILLRRPDLIVRFPTDDSGLLFQLLRKDPRLILKIRNPSFGMYRLAGSLDRRLILKFPVRVIIRLGLGLFGCTS